jgi:hypothetical protein
MFAFMEGEDYDKESGLHHMAHVQSNAMFISYNMRENIHLDDRYKRDPKEEIKS